MARLVLLIVTCVMLINTQVYAAKESKLETAFSATLWGAGIGIVSGLGIAALETSEDEELGTTANRIRNNVVEGFGVGILAGLFYGLFEISEIGTSYYMSYDIFSKQTVVAYNYNF